MSEEQIENPTTDSGSGGESGTPSPDDGYVEPTPEEYGISLGVDPRIDDCFAEFKKCCNTSRNSAACLGALQECLRRIPQNPDAGETPTE